MADEDIGQVFVSGTISVVKIWDVPGQVGFHPDLGFVGLASAR